MRIAGRRAEAERLIGVRRDHPDALLPLARLHFARGEYEEAIGVAGIGVRQMGDDRVRAARLLGIVGTVAAAPRRPHDWLNWPAIAPSRYSTRGPRWPAVLWHSITKTAPRPGTRSSWRCASWPTMTGRYCAPNCICGSADCLNGQDPSAAIAEERAAHLIYDRLGSPEAAKSALLLNSLGLQASSRHRPQDATFALSRREYEVLQLLRVGSSQRRDRQAAAQHGAHD